MFFTCLSFLCSPAEHNESHTHTHTNTHTHSLALNPSPLLLWTSLPHMFFSLHLSLPHMFFFIHLSLPSLDPGTTSSPRGMRKLLIGKNERTFTSFACLQGGAKSGPKIEQRSGKETEEVRSENKRVIWGRPREMVHY